MAQAQPPNPSTWARIIYFIETLTASIARLLGLLVVAFIVFVLIKSVLDRSTEIGEISVPKALADSGYTPEIAARWLRDRMNELSNKAWGRYPAPNQRKAEGQNHPQQLKGKPVLLKSEVPNIVVPTVGMSLSTVITSVRTLWGWQRHQIISGEFFVKNHRLWLRLRLNDVSYYTSDAGVDLENPDDLLLKAAAKIFEGIQPYVSAATENDQQKALDLAKQCIAKMPASDEDVPLCYLLEGDLFFQRQQYAEAKEALTKAGQLGVQRADVHLTLGNIFASQLQTDSAIEEYNKAISLERNNSVAFANRGMMYSIQQKYDQAITDFNEAIRLDPKDPSSFNNRGVTYAAEKEYHRALADYNEAIRLDPTNVSFFLNRGGAYTDNRNYALAVSDYDTATRLDPDNAEALNGACWARAVLGQTEPAIKDCNESLRLTPDDADTLDSRGFAYLKSGKFDKAIADYDAALKIDSQRAASLYCRGLAKNKKGDSAGGDADIAAAIAIKADIAEEFAGYGVK